MSLFETPLTEIDTPFRGLAGPWRTPRNLLQAQTYDDHASIHDDATAQKLGFQGGTIEGPTHFSQVTPLAVALFGEAFLETGCISAHFKAPAFEGEALQALVEQPQPGASITQMQVVKHDGTAVLAGTVSVGRDPSPSALEVRLASLAGLEAPRILADARIGRRSERRTVRIETSRPMSNLYPFSLAEKLDAITEPNALYRPTSGPAVLPFEMISVLCQYTADLDELGVAHPVVGLFADQEVRLLAGPLHAEQDYEIDREVVAMSGSRRTESLWVLTRIYDVGGAEPLATMLLNQAYLKDSSPLYAAGA